jgi:MFS family permease
LGYYFKDVLEVPDVDARWSQFWIMLAQGAGMAIGGLSTDAVCKRLGTTRGRRGIVMTGMGLGALFGLLGVNVTGQWNVAICLAISMGALGMCEGVFWTTATDIGGKSRGFSGAFMNTGGNIGGLISPVLTPIMAGQMGWAGAIVVACVISAIGGLVWFLIKPPTSVNLNLGEAPPQTDEF